MINEGRVKEEDCLYVKKGVRIKKSFVSEPHKKQSILKLESLPHQTPLPF